MVIPEGLIQFEKSGDSAYVEVETKPQVFEKRYINTGLSDGVNIEIKEGIQKDDKLKGSKIDNSKKKQKETPRG
jgi:HlyD family secretion protein